MKHEARMDEERVTTVEPPSEAVTEAMPEFPPEAVREVAPEAVGDAAPDALLDTTVSVAQALAVPEPASTGSRGLDLLADLGAVVADKQASQRERAAAIVKGLKRGGIVSACTALLYWVLLSPPVAMNALYNHVLFRPYRATTATKEILGVPVERVTFPSLNGKKLSGWFIPERSTKKVILFIHGNGGNMDAFVPIMSNAMGAGASVFAFDYQGYGQSEGEPSLDGIVDDAQAAYDYIVKDMHVAPENIVFYGVSLGTGVAAQLLERRPAAALILMSPYTNIIAVAREHLRWLNFYPDFVFPAQHLNTQAVLERQHPPTLIIHGERDQTVLFYHSQVLEKTTKQPVEFLFVPNAAHNDLVDVAPEAIREAISRYVR
jgi:pimeloyl-ACP methyl ester carboxylesterase